MSNGRIYNWDKLQEEFEQLKEKYKNEYNWDKLQEEFEQLKEKYKNEQHSFSLVVHPKKLTFWQKLIGAFKNRKL